MISIHTKCRQEKNKRPTVIPHCLNLSANTKKERWRNLEKYSNEVDNKSIKTLIERAQTLHDKFSDGIKSGFSFCRVCSEHGRYCDLAETPFTEKESLIAIRDSLEEVENKLMFLQILQSWQSIDRLAALTRLENSRVYLMEQVEGHQGKEIDVVKELDVCFGNKITAFRCNSKENREAKPGVHNGKRRILSLFTSFIKLRFNPWRWRKAVGIAVKLLAVSSLFKFHYSRQELSEGKILLSVDSTVVREMNSALIIVSRRPLDVFYGRG